TSRDSKSTFRTERRKELLIARALVGDVERVRGKRHERHARPAAQRDRRLSVDAREVPTVVVVTGASLLPVPSWHRPARQIRGGERDDHAAYEILSRLHAEGAARGERQQRPLEAVRDVVGDEERVVGSAGVGEAVQVVEPRAETDDVRLDP